MTPHTQAAFVTSFVDREGRQPTPQEVWDAAIRSYRDLAQPASIKERWNIERDGDALLVCFNAHEKGEACRYERFVPEAQPVQADAQDAARLHWLEERLFTHRWNGVVGPGARTQWSVATDFRHTQYHMVGFTLRDAIDAAMVQSHPPVQGSES